MGKILSKPKMPSLPATVAVKKATVTKVVSTNAGDPPASSGGSDADNAPEVTPDQQRLENILTRRRGRLGTLATSFNGVLENTALPARKTLLGE